MSAHTTYQLCSSHVPWFDDDDDDDDDDNNNNNNNNNSNLLTVYPNILGFYVLYAFV